jgi:hypothetical protein
MYRSKPGPPRAVRRCWVGLIWLALAAASADHHTRYGLRRARHARHGKWPAEHMHIIIFASVHVTPIATNHALALTMTWPSGIPLRARVPRTWRSKFAKGVGCGSSGHIVTALVQRAQRTTARWAVPRHKDNSAASARKLAAGGKCGDARRGNNAPCAAGKPEDEDDFRIMHCATITRQPRHTDVCTG